MIMVLIAICCFLGLAFFKRYTKYGFYIAQMVFCILWIISTFYGDPNGFISLGHPVWVFASLGALTIRKNDPLFPKEMPKAADFKEASVDGDEKSVEENDQTDMD